jgi:hypothetical protein
MGSEYFMIYEVVKIDSIDSFIGKTKMKELFVVLWLLVRRDWYITHWLVLFVRLINIINSTGFYSIITHWL